MKRLFAPLACLALISCEMPAPSGGPAPTPIDIVEPAKARESSGGELAGLAPVLIEPAMAVDAAASADVSTGFGSARPRAGIVTAADIDDTLNYQDFITYAAGARSDTGLPYANFGRPLLAQLLGPSGAPAPGQRVTLRRPGGATPFYDGFSGVDGMITVFPAAFGAGNLSAVELRTFTGETPTTTSLRTGGDRNIVTLAEDATAAPQFLDLVFVVDTTGSMSDELAFLTAELTSIVSTAARTTPGVDIRYGLVLYRDAGDQYTVRSYPFTNSAGTMRQMLRAQDASGGGDYPEAAQKALEVATDLPWRRGQGERLLFHVADAPPHDEDARAYLNAAQDAAHKGVQIFGLGASGVADESEFLMRQAALLTSGRYLFLTDDSGVGNRHAEPKISCYHVTALKSLLVRVLQSELSGQRIEPSERDIIRSVGTYQNGVCLN